ncbi:retrovirus-related Pol polyprotein from transposon RE1 [Trichonephila clavipes]|nr:retrovirus-related Pol polyprotein from transposon RE1 [Trichonephila clavipes]
MDKEIKVMKERKVWDLVDHPDNIKILENRWVYTIKYDENNKIVRYKARLVARGNTQLRGESFDEVFQEYKLELSSKKSVSLSTMEAEYVSLTEAAKEFIWLKNRDEAHFWLNGYVNKQNCRIWSETNPQVYVEAPLHPEKLTVWCALWAGGILLQKR